jgi:outer membrane receptor protein involved in Fe transport
MNTRFGRWTACALGLSCLHYALGAESTPNTTAAASPGDELQEVQIYGRGEQQIGRASAASEGAVGGADLSVRPMLRVAELLEAVPGLIAGQHSGSGKANQYFLRGFNLDHGTDFTSYIDDMPWNFRTHGHGQGYLDINGLIPETVERIDYRKGPYRADIGDFALSGASFLTTIDKFEHPFVAVETGQYGWGRVAGGGSTSVGDGTLTAAGQWKTYDGPWQQPEGLQHESVWAKYATQTQLGQLTATVSGYHAFWRPTEQIPERAIGTSACANEYCSLDSSATGETLRWIATAHLVADSWRATVYGQYYDWDMFSNPTYDYQIHQFDRRWTGGGRYERQLITSDRFKLEVGTDARYDELGKVGLDHTEDRAFINNVSNNAVTESSIAAYSEANWSPFRALRIMGGFRADLYKVDVIAKTAGSNAGSENAHQYSPKLGVAYTLTPNVEVYANWGQGFHSNDARGAVNTTTPIPLLVVGTGYEGGIRYELGTFRLTATYWWLNLSSELEFDGDTNSVEPGASSKRHGYELVGFWRPVPWLALDAVYAGSHARSDDESGPYLEGAVEGAGEFGASVIKGPWEISARLRYLGPYPLVSDNSERADADHELNFRGAYTLGHVTLYGELLNSLNHTGKDIAYWYAAHVPGLDPDGYEEEGRVSRAEEPRTVRVGVKYTF